MANSAQALDLPKDILGGHDRYAADLADAGLVVDGETLAKLFNLHDRTVRDLAQRDIIAKVGTNRYDLVTSIRNYTSHLREMAAGRGDEQHQLTLTSERARLAKEQADSQALKNAVLRREMVPAAEVEREWSGILRQIRSKVLAMPSRLRLTLAHLTPKDIAVMDGEMRRMLEDLANDQ